MMIRFTDKFRASVMEKALKLRVIHDYDALADAMVKATNELAKECPSMSWKDNYTLLNSFYKYGDNLDY